MTMLTFDVETTGLDPQVDQIVEICLKFGLGPDSTAKTKRIRPTIADMSKEAEGIHGITNKDLIGCPTFKQLSKAIFEAFSEADIIVGYNVQFDIDMLQSEFSRIGVDLDLSEKTIIDPLQIWRACSPRDLMTAHGIFVGSSFDSAHSAEADVEATANVLVGMLKHFGLGEMTWDEVADVCNPNRRTWVGGTHHLAWEEGGIVFGFGKHKGKCILAHESQNYIQWLITQNFPKHVIDVCNLSTNCSTSEMLRERIDPRYLPKE